MIGTTLSHFKITAKLGEGGMGEVYRAEDTKLGREVAIKVLPEAVSNDPERLARFEREAKVLASLNHPHIAGIHQVEQSDGVHFLVMELAEGEDLAERLARGPVPVEEAVPIALQIAEALEAAHERGIVHRDLKPANIKVTPNGQVKVLDFGLAKALDPGEGAGSGILAPDSPSLSPTLTAQMTQAGVILGTAAYMAPEQAAGEAADRRADIWAFGVVLSEMLTGRQQFGGKTTSHVLAAVLKEEPDWLQFPPATPPPILDLIQHCLRKEPTQRLQAIGDARILLQDYLDDPTAFEAPRVTAATASPAVWKLVLPWTLFVVAAVALAALWWMSRSEPAGSGQILRASILPPEGSNFYLAGWNPGPVAVSPDGTKLAFSVQEESGTVRLYVQSLDSGQARALPETESAAYPFWSPDSRWIGFFTDVDQTLKKIDIRGGSPVTICAAENGKGGGWSQEDVILFAPRSDTPIYKVDADGGEPTPITTMHSEKHNSHRHPRFLPDGQHFLYLARAATEGESVVMLGSLDGSISQEIVRAHSQAEYASDRLLFTRGATLMAQPFDASRLVFSGEASPLVEGVSTISGAGLGIYSPSHTGLLVYQVGELESEASLEWRDRAGDTLSTVGEAATFGPIALSPDGEHLASVIFDSVGLPSLWMTDLETGLRTRFTFGDMSNFRMNWSPKGDSLIFSNQQGSQFVLERKAVGGVGETEILLSREEGFILCAVAPDGEHVIFWSINPGTSRDLWAWPVDASKEPEAFRQTEADERCGSFSPDGRWLAYSSNESGRYEIYVAPFPGPGRRWQISDGGGLFPAWQADGREIVYTRQDGQLIAVGLEIGASSMQVGAAEPLFRIHPPRPDGANFSLAPDGERVILWTSQERQSDTVLNLVVNWPAELNLP